MNTDIKILRVVVFGVLSFNSVVLGMMLLINDLLLGMISVLIASGLGVYFTIKLSQNIEDEE